MSDSTGQARPVSNIQYPVTAKFPVSSGRWSAAAEGEGRRVRGEELRSMMNAECRRRAAADDSGVKRDDGGKLTKAGIERLLRHDGWRLAMTALWRAYLRLSVLSVVWPCP